MSILGTWRGERGEEWSSAQGLESILISIQSLMSSNPYENEPGYEDANNSDDKTNQKNYVLKIRHETLRITVIQRLETYLGIAMNGSVIVPSPVREVDQMDLENGVNDGPFEPFKDLCKRRFLWYYDSYLLAINKTKHEVQDGQIFARMPFEGPGNDMSGKFNFTELERRLTRIKRALDNEPLAWAKEGLEAEKNEKGVAVNLRRQFEQIVEYYKRNSNFNIDLEMLDNNPFVWMMTYFGRPMTNLDGGLFRISLNMSVRFPDEWPRVKFETPLFHHRIAADGTPCYTTVRPDDMKSHIEAILEALEDEHPPYDPRTLVNPEASKLFWSTAEDKKKYSRLLRRSVQRSMEG